MRVSYLTLLAAVACKVMAAPAIEPVVPSIRDSPEVQAPQSPLQPEAVLDFDSIKYFHEPGKDGSLGHYDRRYFKEVVTYAERSDTLHHMIRAYLTSFEQLGLETWIAHGTLLGWWWNGKILPWDQDLDTQVSGSTLIYMAKHLNQTMHSYTPKDGSPTRHYLIDVNPHYTQRRRGNGANVIDARWIDTSNGLFVDITALSETHPDTMPGIWSCKNYHRYMTRDLYPMRESVFEGVRAKIPYNYDRMLTSEYGRKALTLTTFEGHEWNVDAKLWERIPNYGQTTSGVPPTGAPNVPRSLDFVPAAATQSSPAVTTP